MRKLLIAAVLLAAPASAQQDLSRVEIRTERVAPGVAVLFGAGGNIGVSYGADGNILIDDQFAPLTPKILAAVRALDPDPVRFVVNTHWHGDHTGGNENLGKAGAVIVAHDNVRRRMSTDQFMSLMGRQVPASPPGALPVVTFAEGVSLHLNGDTLHVLHMPNGHTDGDAIVHWAKADVLHMGDLFFHRESFPFIDRDSGGSIAGLIAAVDRGLALAGPRTVIIPGHGPVARRAELQAYRAMLVDVRDRVSAAIRAGRTREQVIAAKPAARYGMPSGFIKPDVFVGFVYDSLRTPPRAASPGHRH